MSLSLHYSPKINQQQKGKASGAVQSREETARGDGKIPGNMSENAYENFNHENVYENVKLEVSRRPRAPTPPQVSNPPPARR